MNVSNFPSLLQRFFTDRLQCQLGASRHTVASYRDTFRLLLRFAGSQLGREPSELRMEKLDVFFLGKFLEHLDSERHNSTRTRNNRLSAIKAFFRYVSFSEPVLALHCQRILAIPSKRYERGLVEFLTEDEAAALVAAPPILQHGSAGGTERSYSSVFRRDCAIARLPPFDARMWNSAPVLTSVALEKVARCGVRRYVRT